MPSHCLNKCRLFLFSYEFSPLTPTWSWFHILFWMNPKKYAFLFGSFQSIYGTLDKTEIYLNSGLYWGGWWIDAYWCQTINWTNVDLFHQWGHLVFNLSRIRSKIYQNICKTQMNRPGISTALVCTFSVITCKLMSLNKYIDGLLRECGISSASAMEMLQSCNEIAMNLNTYSN